MARHFALSLLMYYLCVQSFISTFATVSILRSEEVILKRSFGTICYELSLVKLAEFQSLLIGEAISHQQEEDEIMISGESSTQPSPPPDSRLFTAQLEGSTLTRAQYNTIHSLTSSFLRIPTSDLVYDGHTLNPLSLHWHCSTAENLFGTLPLLTEMAMTQIRNIALPSGKLTIPQLNVRNYASVITVYYFN